MNEENWRAKTQKGQSTLLAVLPVSAMNETLEGKMTLW